MQALGQSLCATSACVSKALNTQRNLNTGPRAGAAPVRSFAASAVVKCMTGSQLNTLESFRAKSHRGRKCVAMAAASEPLAVDNEPSVSTSYKNILLPIVDSNPYLNESTRQAASVATSLAKKYGAEITVCVIDENEADQIKEHDVRLQTIKWHLAEGGFEEFSLVERLGESKKAAAVIGEVADEMNQDLVILSCEAVHHKHVDANLLAEFVPCRVLLLPL